jgi:hypothetical protein
MIGQRPPTVAEEQEIVARYHAARMEERIYTLGICAAFYRRRMRQSAIVAGVFLLLALVSAVVGRFV